MFTQVISIQLLTPSTVVFYLIITQCELFNNKPKGPIPWKDVNMTANEWEGIQSLIGKDPCANDKEFCNKLAGIIKGKINAKALRKDCECDEMVKYPNGTLGLLCWIRQKKTYDVVKRTVFEAQFWTESPTVSRMRYAFHIITK
uniref:Uncharacterized protein n=1 Tax=Cacopsylla melanoneura TaxID=428564 RepID=A0A8D8M905_9HEMI